MSEKHLEELVNLTKYGQASQQLVMAKYWLGLIDERLKRFQAEILEMIDHSPIEGISMRDRTGISVHFSRPREMTAAAFEKRVALCRAIIERPDLYTRMELFK